MYSSRSGSSLIDLLISLGIIVILFGGIYLVFFSILGATSNVEARTAAVELVNQRIEIMRGMSYDSVGTVGGIPSGSIPQQQVLSIGSFTFTLNTTIRNIDDPFDGTATGSPPPVDTAPADYKLVELEVECPLCLRFVPFLYTTTIAPKNLESASTNGSLFINVFDASIRGVPDAVVRVVNNTVTPSIDLTDTTNASGVLQLVGVPTSTNGYRITVTKQGYSSDRTYPIGGPGNPNPSKPDATVSAQTVTSITFPYVDKVSALTVRSSDEVCAAVPNLGFSWSGGKLIGTNPDVLKFSTSSATNASGSALFPSVEWDTYSFAVAGSYDLEGTIPSIPLTIDPNAAVDLRFIVRAKNDPALLVAVADAATGNDIREASVRLAGPGGYDAIRVTGHAVRTDTDWSGNNYASQDGGVDASVAGRLTLLADGSGAYNNATNDWLISKTIDLGGSSSTLYAVDWTPASEPVAAGPLSLEIQLAANNDDATWNFVGPDGTAGTYFTSTGTTPSVLNGNRYLRYKINLSTADTSTTPEFDDISVDFNSACVPPAQALFAGLSQGSYAIDVTAPGYAEATSSVSVGAGFAETVMQMTHL